MDIDELLTTAQVAERLHVSPRTITRYVAAGQIQPAHRLTAGRGVLLFDPADVDKLADTHLAGERATRAAALREAADALEAGEGPELEGDDAEAVVDWLRGRR